MARILSIDYGRKRVGLAVTDALQITANALDTVATDKVLDYIKAYTQREKVEKFVMGYPMQTNGRESESMQYIRPFADVLKKNFPDIELIYVDERYTSVMAHKTMLDAGLKKKDRQDKSLVDKIAATIILQTYLESVR